MSSTTPVFKIIPTTQKYDWGKKGLSSKVAQFATASKIPGFELDENAPYAELWMGTHVSSPSRLLSGETLSSHLAAHKELIGESVVKKFADAGAADGNLPFLLKILAIAKALSIQTHPDKKMAEQLHQEKPDIYKDPNHKPEMALALTDFTALCGFLPLPKIAAYLLSTPEFAAIIPTAIASRFTSTSQSADPAGPEARAALKDLFAAVMTADEAAFKQQLAVLVQRYEHGSVVDVETDVRELVLTLHEQFPADIGVFCAFMLNYVKMQPGDAIFLAAGEPHAYISGDIVECMATSDNVIRAGLTPKLRDVPNLVGGLTYEAAAPAKHLVQPRSFATPRPAAPHTTLYDPPIPEFAVLRVVLAVGEDETHAPIDGPSVAIVTEGKGAVQWAADKSVTVAEGEVFFVGAGTELKLASSEGRNLVVYRAFVEA
ncbi:mannose-6-phosphate isomerase [Phanerochaete sordida]|uniref:Mannose-6-phosphate isomerase n=1 Tax=Phanerochaete sordida TaxID=48140 RepID=A0A9P3GD17_9APHY|nr:mannose-6-phosphate isomerase [Phanerochaete sordida]